MINWRNTINDFRPNIAKLKQMKSVLKMTEPDADLVIVAYGTSARIAKSAIVKAKARERKSDYYVRLPYGRFPAKKIADLARAGKRFLVVEMSAGQMVEDVRLAANGLSQVEFFGRLNGAIPSVNEVYQEIMKLLSAQGVA